MAVQPIRLAGFLDNKSGQIRDRKTLAELDAKLQSGSLEPEDTAELSDSNEKNIKNALGQVRSRSYEQISSAISNTHSALADAKSAKQHIKKETNTLKALEAAIKEGDTEKAEKLKVEFAELQEERKVLAQKINENNRNRSSETVRFGNKELFKTSAPDVEFKESLGEVDLDKVKDIRRLRKEEIVPERQELNATQKTLKADLSGLEKTLTTLDSKVGQILKDDEQEKLSFSRDYEEASKLAQNSANNLAQIGSQAELVHAISSNALRLL